MMSAINTIERASLLGLPYEIRAIIYAYILKEFPIVYHPRVPHVTTSNHARTIHGPSENWTRLSYQIAFVNKMLSAEFLDHTYTLAPFTFELRTSKTIDFSQWAVSDFVLSKIKTCRFRHDTLRWHAESVGQWVDVLDGERELLVRDLVPKLTSLRRMEAEIIFKAPGSPGGGNTHGTLHSAKMPMQIERNLHEIDWEELRDPKTAACSYIIS